MTAVVTSSVAVSIVFAGSGPFSFFVGSTLAYARRMWLEECPTRECTERDREAEEMLDKSQLATAVGVRRQTRAVPQDLLLSSSQTPKPLAINWRA